jgi:Uma2 family endonuclease
MQLHMPITERLVTAEEFAKIPNDEWHYELVEGRVVKVSPPGSRHGVLVNHIGALLLEHVRAHDLGVVMASGGFCIARGPDTVREPDVAFVRRDRVPESGIPDGYWPGPADLVIEIRSPGDRKGEIETKVADYLARGVRLVWVVDPKKQTIVAYRDGSSPKAHSSNDVLDAGDVVAAFSCTVRRMIDIGPF